MKTSTPETPVLDYRAETVCHRRVELTGSDWIDLTVSRFQDGPPLIGIWLRTVQQKRPSDLPELVLEREEASDLAAVLAECCLAARKVGPAAAVGLKRKGGG